jgi:hypothetical protein
MTWFKARARTTIRPQCALFGQPCKEMAQIMITAADMMDRFERWFDQRFGWFFTNGMKGRPTGR